MGHYVGVVLRDRKLLICDIISGHVNNFEKSQSNENYAIFFVVERAWAM